MSSKDSKKCSQCKKKSRTKVQEKFARKFPYRFSWLTEHNVEFLKPWEVTKMTTSLRDQLPLQKMLVATRSIPVRGSHTPYLIWLWVLLQMSELDPWGLSGRGWSLRERMFQGFSFYFCRMGSASSWGSCGHQSDSAQGPRLLVLGPAPGGLQLPWRATWSRDLEDTPKLSVDVSGSLERSGLLNPPGAQHQWGADPSLGWEGWAGAKSPRAGRGLWLWDLCQRHQSSGEQVGEIPHLIVHPLNPHQPSAGELPRADARVGRRVDEERGWERVWGSR
uniref:Uncharacterized protein n=1 Tax=Canis lupus familiaris TaxID=9615 RepID=A0A8C0TVG0_CANLF